MDHATSDERWEHLASLMPGWIANLGLSTDEPSTLLTVSFRLRAHITSGKFII
jgi:hypothetical protein